MRIFIAILIPFLLNLNRPLISGYQLGGESNLDKKKVREKLSIDHFRYPMVFNNDIYDFLTVTVYGTASPGSGVIIAKNKNEYYVLTANHVIGEILKGDIIEIQTLDGRFHTAKLLNFDNEVDGALIKFSSSNFYYPAFVHPEVYPRIGMGIITTGYALSSKETTKGSLRRSMGQIVTVLDGNKDGECIPNKFEFNILLIGNLKCCLLLFINFLIFVSGPYTVSSLEFFWSTHIDELNPYFNNILWILYAAILAPPEISEWLKWTIFIDIVTVLICFLTLII